MSKAEACNVDSKTHICAMNQRYRRHKERDRTKNAWKATGIPLAHQKDNANLKSAQVTEKKESIF